MRENFDRSFSVMFKVQQAVGLTKRGSTAGSGNNVPCPWHRPDWPCAQSVDTK